MPYEIFLALRYLRSRRRSSLARVTALAAILGIAFGVAALIIALALSNGFQDEMRDKILSSTAHITLMRRDGEPMADFRALTERLIQIPGIHDATGTTYEGALLSGERGAAYAVLRGVDRESARAASEIQSTLIEGTAAPLFDEKQTQGTSTTNAAAALPSVVIGSELAARTGLAPNDVAQLISADITALASTGFVPRSERVHIAGIFRSGLYEYDSTWAYLPLSTASSLAGARGESASVISIKVVDIYSADKVAERVRENFGVGYTTIDWQQANRPLFAALALERRTALFIIALIIFVAAMGVTNTLILVVVQRRADIAILRAMGARATSIMFIFILEGACLGALGAALGITLGLAGCFIGQHYKLVRLPADVYSISNIPFHAHPQDILLAALVAFLLSLLATIYPARAAARVRPAEALRDA